MNHNLQDIENVDEALNRLKKFEDLSNEWLKEYHQCVQKLEQLKAEDKQKTVSYKENFGRKLFLTFILDKMVEKKLINKEDLK